MAKTATKKTAPKVVLKATIPTRAVVKSAKPIKKVTTYEAKHLTEVKSLGKVINSVTLDFHEKAMVVNGEFHNTKQIQALGIYANRLLINDFAKSLTGKFNEMTSKKASIKKQTPAVTRKAVPPVQAKKVAVKSKK